MRYINTSLSLLCLVNFLLGATQKIAVVAIPKSGTHLAKKCVHLLSGKSPAFVLTANDVERLEWSKRFLWAHHMKPLPDIVDVFVRCGIRGIWMVRDPRD